MIHLQTTMVNSVPASKAYKSKDYNSRFGHDIESSIPSFSEDMSVDSKFSNNFNISKKKTAKNISFSGLSLSEVEKIKNSGMWKLFNKNWFGKFIAKADSSQTIFDAIFALGITCALRPAAIMAQSSKKTKEKDKKAASHSISSGLIGYGFSMLLFSPIKTGLDKIKKNPEIYAKKAEKFFRYADKNLNKSMSSSKRMQTYTMLFNKSTEMLTASVRSALTIGMIPYIDKFVFGTEGSKNTKKELQNPSYKFSIINFKNNQDSNKVFQNFTGGIK